MANAIGIDFGTTKTMVSFFNPATERVELIRLGRDRDSIPTTVHVDESGDYLFGDDADDQIETDPEGYCRAFKLHLGEKDAVLPRSDDTAESLATCFLRHVKEECEQSVFHGEAVTDATITVPVSFAPARKASLKRAAEAAGFASVSFLPEPEAAGTAFLRDNPADKFSRALVLDWGGGTLDIAIISRENDRTIRADRHCAEGRDDVGGEEMDRGLLGNLSYIWEQTFGSPLLSFEENEPKLLRESEKVKIGLSRKDTIPFRQGKDKIDITRDQFRQIVEQLLRASVDLVNSALSKNRAQGHSEPDAILLIGGTCQLPVVRDTMKKEFPTLRILSWHHSHEAVALGATSLPDATISTSAPSHGDDAPCLSSENSFGNDLRNPRKKLLESLQSRGDSKIPEREASGTWPPAQILAAFERKFDHLKRMSFPSVGEPHAIQPLPDGGWQMDCGNGSDCNAAITLRPGELVPHEVHGAIYVRWRAEGCVFNERKEPGRLGHPVTDEQPYGGMGRTSDRISYFQHGDITWNSKTDETYVGRSRENESSDSSAEPRGTTAAANSADGPHTTEGESGKESNDANRCAERLFADGGTKSSSASFNRLLHFSKQLFNCGRATAEKAKKLPFVEWVLKWSGHAAYGVSMLIAIILGLAGVAGGREVGRIIAAIVFFPLFSIAAILFLPAVVLFLLAGIVWLLRVFLIVISRMSGLLFRGIRFCLARWKNFRGN